LVFHYTSTIQWRQQGAPTIEVEAARASSAEDGSILEQTELLLAGALEQLEFPDYTSIAELLTDAAVLVRDTMQIMGGIEWVRCSVGGQGVLVGMEDDE
jgi:hypothetical protein